MTLTLWPHDPPFTLFPMPPFDWWDWLQPATAFREALQAAFWLRDTSPHILIFDAWKGFWGFLHMQLCTLGECYSNWDHPNWWLTWHDVYFFSVIFIAVLLLIWVIEGWQRA